MALIRSFAEAVRFMVQHAAKSLDRLREQTMAAITPPLKTEKIMGSKCMPAIAQIRPLKDRLILYVDETAESSQAKELLRSVGISPYVTDGPVEPLDRKPLVIYHGGFYRGLNEIQELVDLLGFWNQQPSRDNGTVFRTGA